MNFPDKELLNKKFVSGFEILPFVYFQIMGNLNNETGAQSQFPQVSKIKKLYRLIKAIPFFRIRKCSTLIFSTTVFNVKIGDTYKNTLHGYYKDINPEGVLLIEDPTPMDVNWKIKRPDDSGINYFFIIISKFIAAICNKIKKRHSADYDIFISTYPELFTLSNLSFKDYYYQIYSFFIKKLIKKSKCHQVIINCGSYGFDYASIIIAARSIGVKTIDVQHGMILNHIAYSASDEIASYQNYYNYLPDELWTFGEYWSNQVSWRYQKIVVGNPYLLDFQYKYINTAIGTDYLIISQAADKIEVIIGDYVDKLATAYPNSSICLRLHPVETIDVYKWLLEKHTNIVYSTFDKVVLYEDIAKSKYVIGINSTCLFESIALDKTPIIIDCEESRKTMPKDLGIWNSNPSVLIDIINKENQIDKDYLWYPDFHTKVSQLLS